MWLCRCRGTRNWLALVLLVSLATCSLAQPPAPQALDANRSISIDLDGSPLVITTTSRLAGAIDSIRWKDREFIDSADHGRQLQSASSFDAMSEEPFWAECFNPTEAGSRLDGALDRSSSRLLAIDSSDREIRTSTQMAFWLNPGEKSYGRSALNKQPLSNHILHKRIALGLYPNPHVIQVDNTFQWPPEESHRYAQFEVLTGYMPSDFSEFWKVSLPSGQLRRLDDGPGEQADPVILSTKDRRFAMGAVAFGKPDWIQSNPGYGRFRFPTEKVVKWNVVYRYRQDPRINQQQASFRVLVMVGSLDQVHAALCDATSGKLKPIESKTP